MTSRLDLIREYQKAISKSIWRTRFRFFVWLFVVVIMFTLAVITLDEPTYLQLLYILAPFMIYLLFAVWCLQRDKREGEGL